ERGFRRSLRRRAPREGGWLEPPSWDWRPSALADARSSVPATAAARPDARPIVLPLAPGPRRRATPLTVSEAAAAAMHACGRSPVLPPQLGPKDRPETTEI